MMFFVFCFCYFTLSAYEAMQRATIPFIHYVKYTSFTHFMNGMFHLFST